jgi:hypothetical protein
MTVELVIESLVVPGFDAAGAFEVGTAVEVELTRLLAERGLPDGLSRSGSVAAITAPQIDLTPGLSPQEAGRMIAHAIYEGLPR